MSPEQLAMMNAVLGLARDYMVLFAPLLGVLGGMHLMMNWLFNIIFRKS